MLESRHMSVKYGLLGILARRSQHGYELRRTFERATGGFWRLNPGQIYQSLDALEAEGLVSHQVEAHDSAPDRKVYAVTEPGRRALAAWLEGGEARVRPLRDELFVRLAVMTDRPLEESLALVAAHRRSYSRHLRELTRARNDLAEAAAGAEQTPPDRGAEMETLLLDAAIFHCEADLRWLDHCETTLMAARRGEAS